jgi:hypothetical protein
LLEPCWQLPVPLQVEPVSVPFVHVVAPHTVPEAYCRQAPAPLQKPSVPHELAPWSAHSESGSVPPAIEPQVPFEPEPFLAAVQAWHAPVQAALQHTPSTQKFEAHAAFDEHDDPLPAPLPLQLPGPGGVSVVPSRQVGAPVPLVTFTVIVACVVLIASTVKLRPPAGSVKELPAVRRPSLAVVAGFMSSSQV